MGKSAFILVLGLALASASAHAAQSPENVSVQINKTAARDAAARKKISALPPAPKLPSGTPKKYLYPFNDGWQEAMRLLQKKDCQDFFAGHGDDYQKVLSTLTGTEYRFLPLGENVGAETVSSDGVFINTDGVFVTAEDGQIILAGRHYDLEDPSRVRAMILLHELGHQLGFFGVDAGPELVEVNASHSLDIINNCLPGDSMPLFFPFETSVPENSPVPIDGLFPAFPH